ncbi:MAG: PASTA domain-containing protein [Eubacterium sp.]|nr:PASTA domain-containing protein [Eubacterium sp.]
MRDIESLCANCFEELSEGAVCANCGYDNDTAVDFTLLQPKSELLERYVVGAVASTESDSVTYSGYDKQLDKRILIREFYPKGMVSRLEGSSEIHVRQKYVDVIDKYKNEFFTLWTTLQKMHSLSAATPVYDVFEENATVYAIIEYMECIPLREYLLRNEEGYISWDTARLMFMPVLTTIEALHNNGIIHGTITPDNLVLCRDGKVRLKAFCIQDCSDITSDFEFVSSDGYTAIEQYENSHKICPATDIYAFTACIYRALVGTNPPAAPAREANDKLMIPNSIAETIPIHVIKAMGNGLQIYPEKRIRNISDFREFLDAAPAVKAQGSGVGSPAEDKPKYDYAKLAEPEKNVGTRIAIIVLSILIILAIAAGFYVVKYTDLLGNKETQPASTTVLKTYQVPNFANNGYTQSDVESNGAWNQQFKFTFNADYSKNVEEGIIFKQNIEPGETVSEGTEIVLTVSKGIQTVEIPDVGNLAIEEATATLEGLGFKVSTVEVYNDGSHTPHTVKALNGSAPAVGETVAVGEEIILQVYGEVQTTAAPETTTEKPQD